jgi:hypothetical protein
MWAAVVLLGEELADSFRCDRGSLWARFGRLDNDGEVEDFFALLQRRLVCDHEACLPLREEPTTLFGPPDSQKSLYSHVSVHGPDAI